jgi:UDP-glucose 4-epimerase
MKFTIKNRNNFFGRVVLIGSSGIISKNLQKKLKIQKIDHLVIGSKNINLLKSKSHISLKKKLKKNDTVVFIAAEAPVKNEKMLINNLIMSSTLVMATKNKVLRQVIYISSDAVYADNDKKIDEKSITAPDSFHGIMHLSREKVFQSHFSKNLLILRPTLIYGKEDGHLGYGPNKFLSLALKKLPISIFGNGEEKRDHVYIDYLINIIFRCINRRALGILNLVSGEVNNFRYIAETIQKKLDIKKRIVKLKRTGPMPHNGYRAFNTKRLKCFFGDIKNILIDEGLDKYIKNFNSL